MNYIKSCLIITMLLGVGYSQSVHLEIQNVNLTAGTLEVYMINEESVSGFQFSLDNIEIIGVSGGLVADNGFMVSSTSTSVLAFTMSNTPIPPTQGVLLVVSFLSQENDNSICINTNGSNPPCLCSGNITYDFNFDNYSNVEDLILLVNCLIQGGSNCNGANALNIVELANHIMSYSTNFPLLITIVDNNGTSIPIDYNCEEECGAELADVNGDSQINILDLVQIANLVLEVSTPEYECAADYNGDGQVNILDLVQIANYILNS